ncbi:MAG: AAA family ATPase, partial [Myxococcales bacterium]|nr:AAA family ATPase [Myxococcales bacterium]
MAEPIAGGSALMEELGEGRLLVCVGPGGVGKTTLAAALAVASARRGMRTALLTIDPARRLAGALGLDGLGDSLIPVPGVPELRAAMLETQTSYDALIERIAPDAEIRDRIFANRVYRSFSRTLARSHAYIAAERLYHVLREGVFDRVVLDTPPTRSALDILDAPSSLSRFLDARLLRLLLAERRIPGASLLRGLLSRALGASVLEEMLTFFSALSSLAEGFRDRAQQVEGLLRAPETTFLLTARPSPTCLMDAAALRDALRARQVRIDACLLNRGFVPEPFAPALPLRPAEIAPVPSQLPEALARRLEQVRAGACRENDARRARAAAFV